MILVLPRYVGPCENICDHPERNCCTFSFCSDVKKESSKLMSTFFSSMLCWWCSTCSFLSVIPLTGSLFSTIIASKWQTIACACNATTLADIFHNYTGIRAVYQLWQLKGCYPCRYCFLCRLCQDWLWISLFRTRRVIDFASLGCNVIFLVVLTTLNLSHWIASNAVSHSTGTFSAFDRHSFQSPMPLVHIMTGTSLLYSVVDTTSINPLSRTNIQSKE